MNTRDSDGYRERVGHQEELFRQVALRGLAESPFVAHPYWGGLGATPRWNNASVPDGRFESFGAQDELEAIVEESVASWPEENAVLALARTNLVGAVDLLWTLVPDRHASSELAELGAKAIAYAEATRQPDWLSSVQNDQQFLTQLGIHVDAWDPPASAPASGTTEADVWESFGPSDAWDRVREGTNRLIGLPGRLLGAGAVAATRSMLHGHVSLFLGDIFVYLSQRHTKDAAGAIPQLVINALEEADRARSSADRHLVIVGHSLGGSILYDVLTHYRPDLRVDALVTVGSQVGVFEELKLFHVSDEAIPTRTGERVSKPPNVLHWINIFDRQDILSFVAGSIFEGVSDFEYSTGASVLGAHTTYFRRPSFHRRLNEQLTAVLR